ncbi:hypothetical protein L345_08973, partial [Ophiophagus hannah]
RKKREGGEEGKRESERRKKERERKEKEIKREGGSKEGERERKKVRKKEGGRKERKEREREKEKRKREGGRDESVRERRRTDVQLFGLPGLMEKNLKVSASCRNPLRRNWDFVQYNVEGQGRDLASSYQLLMPLCCCCVSSQLTQELSKEDVPIRTNLQPLPGFCFQKGIMLTNKQTDRPTTPNSFP